MALLNEPVREAACQRVLVIRVTSVAPIVAPSYHFYPDETTEVSQIEAAKRVYGARTKT